jgi:hypothetical protein
MIELHKLLQSGEDMSGYNRQPVMPVIMVAAGVVLILGAVFWSMNIGRGRPAAEGPTSDELTGQPVQAGNLATLAPPSGAQPEARIPFPDIPRVSLEDAKTAFDAKSAVFIDTRGEPYFSTGHIPGAISMTDNEVLSRLNELDPNTWIITYCT